MAEIRTFPNAEQLAQAAAEHFVEQAAATSAARGRFSVALSGGSTPRAMHRHLVTLAGQVDWTHVHI
ncbi:MAG: 6-phosphogluconolactonase, partial [Anaerolineales bacterium]